MTDATKRCPRCQQSKSAESFSRNRSQPDGLCTYCKDCAKLPAAGTWGTGIERSGHPLYRIWTSMLDRCENPQHHAYHRYGGRGITVYGPWYDFATFRDDIERLIGSRPDGKTLDRYPDNNGNYEPGNVRWATWAEQVANQTYKNGLNRAQMDARRDQVRQLLEAGYSTQQIADALGIHIRSARSDTYKILGRPPEIPSSKICDACEQPYAPSFHYQRFCSSVCKQRWYRHNPR